jgi:hypothetical protein
MAQRHGKSSSHSWTTGAVTCGAKAPARRPKPRAKRSRRGPRWALEGIVVQHLTVARVAGGIGVSWNTVNSAVLAEGKRVLIGDPGPFDGVRVIGIDEHLWRHTRSFPYHPHSFRWRWQHRRAWRTHLRRVVLDLEPFFYVPLIRVAILSPGVQLARSLKLPGQRLTPVQFGISAGVVCPTAIIAAAIGPWIARRLLAWRTTHLAGYLASADKGLTSLSGNDEQSMIVQ